MPISDCISPAPGAFPDASQLEGSPIASIAERHEDALRTGSRTGMNMGYTMVQRGAPLHPPPAAAATSVRTLALVI
eukprot:SAG11_NODE_3384_length_2482_cov_5.328997_3_plen_76_part_00